MIFLITITNRTAMPCVLTRYFVLQAITKKAKKVTAKAKLYTTLKGHVTTLKFQMFQSEEMLLS